MSNVYNELTKNHREDVEAEEFSMLLAIEACGVLSLLSKNIYSI